MAIQSLAQIESLIQPLAVNANSINDNFAPAEDDELDLSSDPNLAIQKQLIETLFSPDDDDEMPILNQKKDNDTITISNQALELYEREYGHIIYENGDERLEIEFERVEYLRVEESVTQGQVQEAEPLVLDLNGNGIELTDVRKGDGVNFDITGDGKKEQVSWVSANDGMLVYDRNGNSIIDSGKELFGDQHGATDGFEELSKFDTDKNGVIDKNDNIYKDLEIWQDINQNGFSEADELKSIQEYGIDSIDLDKDDTKTTIAGNRVEGYASYHSGTTSGKVGEVFFNYIA